MRIVWICMGLLLGLAACKEAKKGQADSANTPAVEVPESEELVDTLRSLAVQHGFDHWQQVEELRFTFNVDRGDAHYERSWIWRPGTGQVSRIQAGDTITYQRSELDSTLMEVDAGFINDKYWLLAPYQWVWDRDSFTYTLEDGVAAPLSGATSRKLTIVYGDQGGYTPGDAYDFYLGPDVMVREWVYRKGNQPEPSTITTWEEYEDHEGLQIATMHSNEDGSFKLYFTGVGVN